MYNYREDFEKKYIEFVRILKDVNYGFKIEIEQYFNPLTIHTIDLFRMIRYVEYTAPTPYIVYKHYPVYSSISNISDLKSSIAQKRTHNININSHRFNLIYLLFEMEYLTHEIENVNVAKEVFQRAVERLEKVKEIQDEGLIRQVEGLNIIDCDNLTILLTNFYNNLELLTVFKLTVKTETNLLDILNEFYEDIDMLDKILEVNSPKIKNISKIQNDIFLLK